MERTNVCLLEYPRDGLGVEEKRFDKIGELKDCLAEMGENDHVKTRLFVVEDLSRDVIEALGFHFKVDPSFFREHIVDYAWYNTSKWPEITIQILLVYACFYDASADNVRDR